jgi:hypothetical protein
MANFSNSDVVTVNGVTTTYGQLNATQQAQLLNVANQAEAQASNAAALISQSNNAGTTLPSAVSQPAVPGVNVNSLGVPPLTASAQAYAATTVANNPSGKPGANTQVFDDGSALTTYADGSTKTIDTSGSSAFQASPAQNQLAIAKGNLVSAQQTSSDSQAAVNDAQSVADEKQAKYNALLNDPESTAEQLNAAQAEAQTSQQALQDAQIQAAADAQAVDDAQSQIDSASTLPDGTPVGDPAIATNISALQDALNTAQSNLQAAIQRATDAETAVQAAEDNLALAQESGDDQAIQDAQDALDSANETLSEAQDDVANAQSDVDDAQSELDDAQASAEGSTANVTNPSDSDTQTAKQYADPSAISSSKGILSTLGGLGSSALGLGRGLLNSQPGAPVAGSASFPKTDLRVKLRVPTNYLVGPAAGPAPTPNQALSNALGGILGGGGLGSLSSLFGGSNNSGAVATSSGAPVPIPGGNVGVGALAALGGIVFPYTPQVAWSNQASYQQNKVMHSNFPFYNYQNSSVGPITVAGKFTAQTEYEGAVILATLHLLRSLTKMKFGDDSNAGAPPPVCRFDAYGDYMLSNVPVSVADFKLELPENVDYIQVGQGIQGYGSTMVPTSCTISITLNVMYSRQEALQYGVDAWLQGKLAGKGYL